MYKEGRIEPECVSTIVDFLSHPLIDILIYIFVSVLSLPQFTMYFSNITPKKALALLPLLLSLTSNTGATSTGIGYCDNDESGMESSPNDGITSDKSAGIGIEFETAGIQFSSVSGTCGADDTFQAKGEIVASRSGTNWELTADTLGGDDELSAEYIIVSPSLGDFLHTLDGFRHDLKT